MPRTQPKKSEEMKPLPKKSEENERNRRKMKPSPKKSHVHVFSLRLGSWFSPLGFVGSPPEYVGFAAWVRGFAARFVGLLLGFAIGFMGSPPWFVVSVLISCFVWFLC